VKLDEVVKLIDICIEKRVSSMKLGDIDFTLDLPPPPEAIKAAEEMAEIMRQTRHATDEDILMNPMAGLEGAN